MSTALRASATEACILHEDDEFVVIHRPGTSDFTLVTFADMGERPQGLRIWAQEPVQRLDLHAIGFVGKRATWYPAESVARVAPQVRALLHGPAIGYGFGMGGYGVLKHGRLLGLDAALAVSPQVTIDPAALPQDHRYHRHFDARRHAGMAVAPDDLPDAPIILADPHDPLDRLHAEAAGPPGRIARVWLPFARQGIVSRLNGTRPMADALARVLAGDPAGLAGLLRARRRHSRHWHHQMAHAALLRGHDAMAQRLWEAATALGTPGEAVAQLRLNAERERDSQPAPRWRRDAQAGANAALLAAAEAGDAHSVCRLAARLSPAHARPRAVIATVNSALALDDGAAIDGAAVLAIATNLPAVSRSHAAHRLASAGRGVSALAVMLADPDVLEGSWALAGRGTCILARQRDRAMPPLWREVARALSDRLAPDRAADAPEAPASPFTPAAAMARPRALSGFPWIGQAPRSPPAATHEYRRALEIQSHFEAPAAAAHVVLLRDVFVNQRGQVWSRGGVLHRRVGHAIAEASLAAMDTAPQVAEAAFAVEPYNNIYHWTVDTAIGIAWRLEGAGGGMPVLLRQGAAPFVQDWLDTAAHEAVPTIGVGAATFVRRLHMGSVGLRNLDPFGAHESLLARIGARVDALGAPGPRRVYVSRRDGGNRPLRNEEALEEALRARGFEIVTFRGLPVARQAALVRDAEAVVSLHGAGLVNLALARPGRRVFEIVPATTGIMFMRACFAQLSRLCGHHHEVWIAPFNDTFGTWSLELDPALAQIERFLAGEAPPDPA